MIEALFSLITALFNIVWLCSIIFIILGLGLLCIAIIGIIFIRIAQYFEDKRLNR